MTRRSLRILLGIALASMAAGPVASGVRSLWMTRQAVASYARLIAAANAQDLDAVRAECSSRYLRDHEIRPSEGGGVADLPRNIHRNFQAWREGPDVWLCPTDRQGPVYRFIWDRDAYRFDGLAGLLRGGRVEGVAAGDF
ncbi:hypothetical protein TA3x_004733 [Tundrisphaera sp. TA3]|uniref:hypothetical protein n=1 Tax=Tundrisphaera sp. TA3 TaxID=3435775 RepID=UPI003EBC061E